MKLLECVPNFSEGREDKVIQAVIRAASEVPGVALLDRESNADHNRSVLSLAGPSEAVAEAAFRATKVAVELIDLNHHKGEHPRMGAMDVVPFVPLGESTMEDAVRAAHEFGNRVWKELKVPVYFYGNAAKTPLRMDLAEVRKGQFEGLREAVASDPTRAPDVGERRLHPTAGAIAVGARPVLIAYNAYLTTPDVAIAKKIARSIRHRDGGLAEVKALGFDIRERGRAQVSMNMTDYRRTPLHRAVELIRAEAARYGAQIEETEIVGLVPEDALLDAAEHYLQLNHFDRLAILERRIPPGAVPHAPPTSGNAASEPPRTWSDRTLREFVAGLSARTPTPGGGSASALSGALGVGLGEMVLRYSRPAGEAPPELLTIISRLSALRERLLSLVDEDSAAYEEVRAARSERKAAQAPGPAPERWIRALERAARVPLERRGERAGVPHPRGGTRPGEAGALERPPEFPCSPAGRQGRGPCQRGGEPRVDEGGGDFHGGLGVRGPATPRRAMTEGGTDPWPPGSPSADRPVVWVNCAMSLDGKIALAGGRRARLSGPADLERVQRIRAHSDAILVGRGTVEKDDPSLRVHWELLGPEGEEIRRSRGAGWAPWRICLDTRGGIPASSRILDGSAPTAIITTRANSRRYPPHVRVASLPGPEVDLPEALRWLRKELGSGDCSSKGAPQ